MTDKLKAAAEVALEALEFGLKADELPSGGHWDNMANKAIAALRQALNQLPNTTKMMGLIPSEWAGLEEPPNSTTDVVESVALAPRELELIDGMIEAQIRHANVCDNMANRVMAQKQKGWDMERVALLRKIKNMPLKQEFVCSTGLCHYKHWVGLTDEEILEAANIDGADIWVFETAYAIEAKLKEKNNG